MTDTRVQIGFIAIALGFLLFAAWCYAFDRNLDRLELKVGRHATELADARADTQALAAHLGLEILPAVEDDSPHAMAAQEVSDETQPIPAQPQRRDEMPTMPDLKKASQVAPPAPNWVEAELADIRARSGRRNAQRPTAQEPK